MAEHGNSKQNPKIHHLYEIRDSLDDDVFKYGISHDPIDENGLSKRMRLQINFLNLGVSWQRFFGRIIVMNIEGRIEANRIETEHILSYKEKHGKRPRGNLED